MITLRGDHLNVRTTHCMQRPFHGCWVSSVRPVCCVYFELVLVYISTCAARSPSRMRLAINFPHSAPADFLPPPCSEGLRVGCETKAAAREKRSAANRTKATNAERGCDHVLSLYHSGQSPNTFASFSRWWNPDDDPVSNLVHFPRRGAMMKWVLCKNVGLAGC